MDKTQGIGLILLFIVFAGYFMLTAPTEAEIAQRQLEQDSIANAQTLDNAKLNTKPVAEPIIAATDTAAIKKLESSYGAFGNGRS